MINHQVYPTSYIVRQVPLGAAPVQLAPQGFFGDLVGHLAPTVGGALGGLLGHANTGAQIGGVVSNLSHLIPFSAGPQLAPQGFFGDLVGHLAPTVGGAIGGIFGHGNTGAQIGGVVSNLSHLIPFSAGPQLAPQGVLGDLVSKAGHVVSEIVHSPITGAIVQAAPGIANNAGYHTVGSVLSVLTSQLGNHPVGAALSKLAPLLGNKAAEVFGQPALATVGNLAGQGAALLPFSASPSFIQTGY
ncbi:hypothetical protein GJ699_14395 [Duganella sp. FT80W]|uniref:Uncharacterized protein n=1 Tax=Duganella guangzhouensis TaxID=2666084 RepID=A0A6I2L054_9BURK|nr:hypothetical protein [Duganella guangzhouensis]MRW91182.1 hypothetical protein [Duganella guangzhouensis]